MPDEIEAMESVIAQAIRECDEPAATVGAIRHYLMRAGYGLLKRARADERERAGLYVASRASLPERGQMWRALRDSGVRINSSWIDEDGPGQSHDLGELWQRIEREVVRSERLILYAEPDDFPLKGALIEVGMALSARVPVSVVIPGVVLEPRSMRPLGSWALHPLVSFAPDVAAALRAEKGQTP